MLRLLAALVLGIVPAFAAETVERERVSPAYSPDTPRKGFYLSYQEPGYGKCSGYFASPSLKNVLGITDSSVSYEQALDCFAGDFDGNGMQDYALVTTQGEGQWRAVAVLMRNGKSAMIVPLSRVFHNTPILYSARHYAEDKKLLLQYECPVNNKNDGIIEWGEGGTTHIFLWNEQKLDFDETTCLSELS
jgi:hypothetical protein